MERLAHEDRIHARVLERDRLRAPRDRLAVQRAHPLVRLNGDDVLEAPYELPSHAARSGPQVEHARLGVELEHLLGAVEQHPRIRGPDAVVGLGDVAEAEAQLSQLRRAGTRGSL